MCVTFCEQHNKAESVRKQYITKWHPFSKDEQPETGTREIYTVPWIIMVEVEPGLSFSVSPILRAAGSDTNDSSLIIMHVPLP